MPDDTPPMTAISDEELAELRQWMKVNRHTTTLAALLARLDAAEAATALMLETHQHCESLRAHLADVEAESAAKDAVIRAARALDGCPIASFSPLGEQRLRALAAAVRALNPQETADGPE